MGSFVKQIFLPAVLFCCIHWCQTVRNCTVWEAAEYRDCQCSVMIRDVETHCHDEETYYEPIRTQERFQCGYICANGGKKAANRNFCRCVNGYSGKCCTQETPLCGELFLGPHGVIKTPNYPNQYPRNRRCVWQIATDVAKRIALGVRGGAFSIQEGSGLNTCDRDYVTVYDGDSKDSQRIGPFCGNTSRPFQTIHSTGRHLYIEFQSDSDSIQYSGFQLEYITYRTGMQCGPRQEFSLRTAIITSPQYPLMHKPQDECEYEISVMPGHLLVLTTLYIDLPGSADCSTGNVIEIMKKSNVSSDYEKHTRLCGKENYAPLFIRNSSHVLLKLSSNFINGGQFKLKYEQIP